MGAALRRCGCFLVRDAAVDEGARARRRRRDAALSSPERCYTAATTQLAAGARCRLPFLQLARGSSRLRRAANRKGLLQLRNCPVAAPWPARAAKPSAFPPHQNDAAAAQRRPARCPAAADHTANHRPTPPRPAGPFPLPLTTAAPRLARGAPHHSAAAPAPQPSWRTAGPRRRSRRRWRCWPARMAPAPRPTAARPSSATRSATK